MPDQLEILEHFFSLRKDNIAHLVVRLHDHLEEKSDSLAQIFSIKLLHAAEEMLADVRQLNA